MFIVALFTIARTWKQPRCPLADEWIRKLWYIYTMDCCCIASVMSDSVGPHGLQPTRLPRPWDSPGKNTAVGCHFLLQCMKVESESQVAQSCLTLSDPMDCSLPGSSAHGIFQARVLEWVAIAFSLHNGPLLSFYKECIWIGSNEVGETGAYYTEWSRPERKTPIQYTNTYICNLERW